MPNEYYAEYVRGSVHMMLSARGGAERYGRSALRSGHTDSINIVSSPGHWGMQSYSGIIRASPACTMLVGLRHEMSYRGGVQGISDVTPVSSLPEAMNGPRTVTSEQCVLLPRQVAYDMGPCPYQECCRHHLSDTRNE